MKFIGLCYGINCTIGSLIGVVVFFASIVAMFYNFWLGLALFVGINIVMKICEKINVFLFYKKKNVDLPPILLSNFWIRLLRLCLAATFVCFILAQIYLFIFGVVIAVRAYNPQKKPIESIVTRESNLTLRGVKTDFGLIIAPQDYKKDYVRVDSDALVCLFDEYYSCYDRRFSYIMWFTKEKLAAMTPREYLGNDTIAKFQAAGYTTEQIKGYAHDKFIKEFGFAPEAFKSLGYPSFDKNIFRGEWAEIPYDGRQRIKHFIIPIPMQDAPVFGQIFDARYGKRWEWFIETVGMPSGIVYGLFYSILFAIAALQYLIFGRWSQEWLMKLDKGS